MGPWSDVLDAEPLGTAEDERRRAKCWMDTAGQAFCNTDYYRSLVVKIGEMLGPAAKTRDDGSVVPDVLCAKVPELVAAALRSIR